MENPTHSARPARILFWRALSPIPFWLSALTADWLHRFCLYNFIKLSKPYNIGSWDSTGFSRRLTCASIDTRQEIFRSISISCTRSLIPSVWCTLTHFIGSTRTIHLTQNLMNVSRVSSPKKFDGFWRWPESISRANCGLSAGSRRNCVGQKKLQQIQSD